MKEINVLIRKVDYDAKNQPIKGAKFTLTEVTGELTSGDDGYLANGANVKTLSLETPNEKNGVKEYTLNETAVPTGYTSDGDVTIKVSYDGIVTYTQGNGSEQEASPFNGASLITVTNTKSTLTVNAKLFPAGYPQMAQLVENSEGEFGDPWRGGSIPANSIRWEYGNKNEAVQKLNNDSNAKGFAYAVLESTGEKIINIHYVSASKTWQYQTAENANWRDIARTDKVSLYYFNMAEIPVYYVLINDDGTYTKLDPIRDQEGNQIHMYNPERDIVSGEKVSIDVNGSFHFSTVNTNYNVPGNRATEKQDKSHFIYYNNEELGYQGFDFKPDDAEKLTINDAIYLKSMAEGVASRFGDSADFSNPLTNGAIFVIYKVATVDLTITKNVTGGWGDKTREFAFTVSYYGMTK
ncbi:MAG: hypothetical protein IJ171_02550, partial [Ruminococcus sp.]|nr:hypothetical protein [Ruminococcus sp.]